jgi:hypothetical protein
VCRHLKFVIDRVAIAHGLKGEIKWSKLSARHLEGYLAVIDVFARRQDACFRVMLVDQSQLDLNAFH